MKTGNQVFVKPLPKRLDIGRTPAFWREIEARLTSDKPQIVLDCSAVRQIDSAGVEMLLQCMEQVMKRDGDLKLAAVSPEAAVILRLTRIDRVFEIFDTVSAAVMSFMGFSAEAIQSETMPWSSVVSGDVDETAELDRAV